MQSKLLVAAGSRACGCYSGFSAAENKENKDVCVIGASSLQTKTWFLKDNT